MAEPLLDFGDVGLVRKRVRGWRRHRLEAVKISDRSVSGEMGSGFRNAGVKAKRQEWVKSRSQGLKRGR
ncbi:MAG: hypothetical protein ABSD45_04670, partial [Terriglobia bacterium]